MSNYTGITIGPIIRTLSMARKPRELWTASYLFSGLMERLVEQIGKENDAVIIAPGVVNETGQVKREITVGLYPDRLFCKGVAFERIGEIIREVVTEYATDHTVYADYFKVYATEIHTENDGQFAAELNQQLGYLELYNKALSHEAEESVRNRIVSNELFKSKNSAYPYETLAEIASARLEQLDEKKYKMAYHEAKAKEAESGKDSLIEVLSKKFDEFITPYKYICVVHADGDNVGDIVGGLGAGKLKTFNENFLIFGQNACASIEKFKGLPVYAGGDDLLFIAPVVSSDNKGNPRTIFDLIKQIDDDFKKSGVTGTTLSKDGKTLTPSLSFGIAITYYKYPLYETLEMSRKLLDDVAKKLTQNNEQGQATEEKVKNAIAWTWQKGSGFSVSGCFSRHDMSLFDAFANLIDRQGKVTDKNLVSAVAHKIKSSESLFRLFMGQPNQESRLTAFFDQTLEYKDKKENEKKYLDAVKQLLKVSYPITNNIRETIQMTYAMLRTAKFIKGLEDDKDE